MATRRTLHLLAACAAAALLPACALGERPTLAEQSPVVHTAANAVLERLDREPTGEFVATYSITPSSADAATEAVVTRTADGTLTAEIGSVVYTSNPDGTTTTCAADGTECEDFANDARISDLAVTHRFWGPSFERRLRTDSGRRVGTSTGSVTTIAGQTATCVAITVPSSLDAVGEVAYCALDNGLLGRYHGADGIVELTALSVTAR